MIGIKLPSELTVEGRISKRTLFGKFNGDDIVVKLYTEDDLKSSAARIKDVRDYSSDDFDEIETTLEERVLYNVNVHYLIQKSFNVSMSTGYYCFREKRWIHTQVVQTESADSDVYEYLSHLRSRNLDDSTVTYTKHSGIPFVQLKHVIGVKFDAETETFIPQNQAICLIFPRLNEPIMDYSGEFVWKVNSKYSLIFSSERKVSQFFRNVLFSVVCLFDKLNIAHKDIKIENICTVPYMDTYLPVLIDFGESQILMNDKRLIDAYGTHSMLPPEAFLVPLECFGNPPRGYCSEKREVWTLGCLLHIMVFGYPPLFEVLSKKTPIEFQFNLCDKNQKIAIPEYSNILQKNISKELNSLLLGLLCKDPDSRFKFDDILNDPWITWQID